MKKLRKKTAAMLLVFSFICIASSILMIFIPHYNNWKLMAAGEKNAYLSGEALNGKAMARRLISIETAFPGVDQNCIMLKSDIPYFLSPEDAEPVCIVPAGEVYFDRYDLDSDYGFFSWPSYTAGWRYAEPFVSMEGWEAHGEPAEYYYVRMEDLIKAIDWDDEYAQVYFNIITFSDRSMYEQNVYYSQDLNIQIWDPFNITLLAIGGGGLLLCAGWSLLEKAKKKKQAE